jgi:hypothetical protein
MTTTDKKQETCSLMAEALRAMLDRAHPAQVGDDFMRQKLIDTREAARAALAAYEAEAKPAEPVVTQTPIAARKVAALIEQGWKPVGYVMDKEGERTAITIDAAVAWLTTQDVYRLMFIDGRVVELPAAAPAAPAPLTDAQIVALGAGQTLPNQTFTVTAADGIARAIERAHGIAASKGGAA